MKDRLRFVVTRAPWLGVFQIWMGTEDIGGRIAVAHNLQFTLLGEGERPPDTPTLSLTHAEAQALIERAAETVAPLRARAGRVDPLGASVQ